MIKQMDKMVTGLEATWRRAGRIAKYLGRVTAKVMLAATLPIWLIPYLIWRR